MLRVDDGFLLPSSYLTNRVVSIKQERQQKKKKQERKRTEKRGTRKSLTSMAKINAKNE